MIRPLVAPKSTATDEWVARMVRKARGMLIAFDLVRKDEGGKSPAGTGPAPDAALSHRAQQRPKLPDQEIHVPPRIVAQFHGYRAHRRMVQDSAGHQQALLDMM